MLALGASAARGQFTVDGPGSLVSFAPNQAEFFHDCPPAGGLGPASCAATLIPFGFPGADMAWACTPPVYLDDGIMTATEDSLIRVNGIGTYTLRIRWDSLAYTDYDCHRCPCWYFGYGYNTTTASIMVTLTVPGVPAGTPITICYRWRQFSAAMPSGPATGFGGGGNLAAAAGSLGVAGTPFFNGEFDLVDVNGSLSGGSPPPFSTMSVPANTPFPVDIFSYVDAWIFPPASGCLPDPLFPCNRWGPEHDTASSGWRGELYLFVCDSEPPTCPEPTLEFSVDIGGDAERSDPLIDGNEGFEPFDTYLAGGPALSLPAGEDGIRTDDAARGADLSPAVPGGAGAPSCTGGVFSPLSNLDLDGTDSVDFTLSEYVPLSPPTTPIARSSLPDTTCIQRLEYLLISFDDDGAEHYVGAAGSCPVPSGSASPILGATYGSPLQSDEIIALATIGAPGGMIAAPAPAGSESDVHVSLLPNPPPSTPGLPTPQELDDDVDALDAHSGMCPIWLFGVDHEARAGFSPSLANQGIVWQWDPAAGPVVTPVITFSHLGLPLGVDLRDFELVFVGDPSGVGGEVLALIFAVAPDDPLTTTVVESAGLDSRMIYISYLTGSSSPLLSAPLADSVDAITNWCSGISRTMSSPTTCPTCRGDTNGDGLTDARDIGGFTSCYLTPSTYRFRGCRCADLNDDGFIDEADLNAFVLKILGITDPDTLCP